MLLLYTGRNGPIPFKTTVSVSLDHILSDSDDVVVRDNGRNVALDKVDLLFKEAETVDEIVYIDKLLNNLCEHKKFVGICIDREAQGLQYDEAFGPYSYCMVGGWLYEAQTFHNYEHTGHKDTVLQAIFHKIVFQAALESNMEISEIRIELADEITGSVQGYYYAFYEYKNRIPYKLFETKKLNDSRLCALVNGFLN